MYKDHPLFIPPAPDATLWRYMDVTKLIALLEAGCLFFARADRLGDPWEGALSRVNYAMRPQVYAELDPAALETLSESLATALSEQKRHTFVSCWHQNDYESAAMWKLYLKSDEGIAVRTTFDRLTRSLDAYSDQDVYIGRVTYLDYKAEFVPEWNAFAPFLHKRKSFAHENEVRAIISTSGVSAVTQPAVPEYGINVPASLEVLVERIFVAPTVPDWLYKAVEGMVGRYGLKHLVCSSAMSEAPVF